MMSFKMKRIRCLAVVLSIALLFGLVSKLSLIDTNAAGPYFDNVEHGTYGQALIVDQYYYIKNVHTAQYLTVKSGETNENTEIVQSWFHGGNSQKWKLRKVTSGYYAGYYFLVSALMSNMVLAMYESPGDQNTQAVLKTINYNNNLMFLSLSPRSDSSYYLRTNSTGNSCALNVRYSSFAQLAKITQKYIYNDNCAWFFEPADQVITSFGVNYAYNNWWSENPDTGEIVAINTYPYFTYGDCANFVSQCLNASGFKYQDEWRINKWNDNYPYPANSSQLDNSWETYTNILGISPWISAQGFQDFWVSRVDYSYDTIVLAH